MLRHFPLILFGLGILGLSALTGCSAHITGLTSAQIVVLRQQGFHPNDGGWELGIEDKILFASNSDEINPETSITIQKIGLALLSVEINNLRVEGHTDQYGTDAYNDDLSLRRAEVVAGVLEKVGFLSTNIQVRGLGKQDPVSEENTLEGQAENRRVSIIVPDIQ